MFNDWVEPEFENFRFTGSWEMSLFRIIGLDVSMPFHVAVRQNLQYDDGASVGVEPL